MLVALGRRGLGRLAEHGAGTRWHDNRRLGMACSDTAVDTFLIIPAVAGERGDRSVYLVEQGTDLRAVIGMLVDQPLTRATQLQARAVHQQVHGFAVAARSWSRHLQRLGPAA